MYLYNKLIVNINLIARFNIQYLFMKNQRLEGVELLRGVAAIVICLYHFTDNLLPKENLMRAFFHEGYAGVDSFFMITGFVVPLSFAAKNYHISQIKSYFLKRFIRLEPAYWASILFMFIKDAIPRLDLIRQELFPMYGLHNLTLHFFHLNDIVKVDWIRSLYWTLAIDWQFYIAVLLIFPLLNRAEYWARWVLYIALLALQGYSSKAFMPYHIVPFLIGIILFHNTKGWLRTWEFWLAQGVVLAYAYWRLDTTHLVACGLSLLIIIFVQNAGKIGRFLGENSYSLYLTHVATGWTLIWWMLPACKGEFEQDLLMLFSAAFSLFFAKIFYEIIEKPTMRWAKKV